MNNEQLSAGIAESRKNENTLKKLEMLRRALEACMGQDYSHNHGNYALALPHQCETLLSVSKAMIANWKNEEDARHKQAMDAI